MKSAFLLGAASIALASPALGQTAAATANAEVEVIVVEATHTKLNAFEYPGMTSTISAETLDLGRPADLDDLLRQLPGMEIAGGPDRPMMAPSSSTLPCWLASKACAVRPPRSTARALPAA